MKKLMPYLAGILLLGVTVFVYQGHTSAGPLDASSLPSPATLSAVSPAPNDSSPQGAHVFLMRSNSNRGQNTKLSVNAYYPSDVTNWGQQYIEISNPGGACDRDNGQGPLCNACDVYGQGVSDKTRYVEVDINEDTYFISINNVCRSKAAANTPCTPPGGAGPCANDVLFARYKLPNKAAALDGDTGLYKVSINIKYTNPSEPNTKDGNNDMTLKIVGMDNGTGRQTDGLLIGPNGTGGGSYNFPLIGKSAEDGHDTWLTVPFGLPCKKTADVPDQKIGVYDADNFGAFGFNVQFSVYDNTNDKPVDFHGGSDGKRVNTNGQLDPNGNWFRPNGGNGTKAYFLIDMQASPTKHVRYELRVKFIDGGNTIVVSLPQDTIYGAITCQTPKTPTLSCNGFSTSPATIAPGDEVTATFGAHTTGFSGSPPSRLNGQIAGGSKNPSGALSPSSSGGSYFLGDFDVGTFTAGSHTITATISDPTNQAPPIFCTGTFTVVNQPYLSIYGGDASAGVAATTDGATEQCTASPASDPAGFISWNNGSAGSWSGAGAQFAVQALGRIQNFASGRGSNPSKAPTGLSFANTDSSVTDPTNGLFGGKIGAITGVACNYTDGMPAPLTTTQTITGRAVSGDDPIYVKGADVIIKADAAGRGVYYTSTAWGSLAQIPSFKLVVQGGNIYIDKAVTQLDGIFIAERDTSAPANKVTGVIYTCTNGGTQYAPSDSDFYSSCNNPLTINGSFVAQQVQFLRTSGSVGDAGSNDSWNSGGAPAEKFVYGPEVWLANLKAAPGKDASITGLPPTL